MASQWISTTSDIEWAIWEIARRFSVRRTQWADLTVIKRNMYYTGGYRGARMLGLDPGEVLLKQGFYNVSPAVAFARASSELVWLGRIFPKDILESSEWDVDVSPDAPRAKGSTAEQT